MTAISTPLKLYTSRLTNIWMSTKECQLYVLERLMKGLFLAHDTVDKAKAMICGRLRHVLVQVKDQVVLMQFVAQGTGTLDTSSYLIHQWLRDDNRTSRLE